MHTHTCRASAALSQETQTQSTVVTEGEDPKIRSSLLPGQYYYINCEGRPDGSSAPTKDGFRKLQLHPCYDNQSEEWQAGLRCTGESGTKCPEMEVGLWPCKGKSGKSDYGWISRCCPKPSSGCYR